MVAGLPPKPPKRVPKLCNTLFSPSLSYPAPQAQDTAPVVSEQEVMPPRLIVLISVDQLIPEQLVRLEDHLPGGLGRVHRESAYFPEAALPYACTETGPGHATMSTGCLPHNHGIVGNVMGLREEGTTLYCVGDPEARDVKPAGISEVLGSNSAKNLEMPSLGDYLKQNDPASRVFTVSGKDRSAVCMAGKTGDLALWWDVEGGFISSDAYTKFLPEYVIEFDKTWATRSAGLTWLPSFEPKDTPPKTAADDRPGEGQFPGGGPVFPHQFVGEKGKMPEEKDIKTLSSQVQYSPWGDVYSLEMAQTLLFEERLGVDDATDLLGISLSGPDKVGHFYGPYSMEVTDCLLRLDRDLKVLFDAIDAQVGKDRWVLAFTADHGVLPLPESDSKLHGVAGMGRVTSDQVRDAKDGVAEVLKEKFGADDRERGMKVRLFGGHIYFEREDLATRKIDVVEARAVAAKAMAEVDWVAATYTLEQLRSEEPTEDPYLILSARRTTSATAPM